MKGGHDLGGRQGLGPINPEPEQEEPYFHAEWERRVFAMTLATGMLGQWNIDQSRFARESQHPADYLKNSYYENWLVGIQKLLIDHKLLSKEELNSEDAVAAIEKALRIPDAEDALKIIQSGGPTLMDTKSAPKYAVGDLVRARKIQTDGHSRLPAYVQGSVGVIEEHYGCHVYPDKNSQGHHMGEHLYCVKFSSTSLWGSNAEDNEVLVDLWEPYLEKSDRT